MKLIGYAPDVDQLISENNAEMISGGALTARVR
jgi:hypothetical protein